MYIYNIAKHIGCQDQKPTSPDHINWLDDFQAIQEWTPEDHIPETYPIVFPSIIHEYPILKIIYGDQSWFRSYSKITPNV